MINEWRVSQGMNPINQDDGDVPDLEEVPIELPCQELRDEVDVLRSEKSRISYQMRQVEWQFTQARDRWMQETQIQQERLDVCANRIDLLVQQSEQVANQPTCPPQIRCPTISCPDPAPCICPTTRAPATCPPCATCAPPLSCPKSTCPTCPPRLFLRPCPTSTPVVCPTCPPTRPTTLPSTCPPPVRVTPCPTSRPYNESGLVTSLDSDQISTTRIPRGSVEPLPTPRQWSIGDLDQEHGDNQLVPKFDDFDLTQQQWHEDVSFQSVHFSKAGTLAGSVSFVHLVHDIDIKKYLEHGRKLCSKEIKETLNNLTLDQMYVYRTMSRVLTPKCNQIVDQLHDTYDTFVAGSETIMTHPDFQEEHRHASANTNARSRRQLIIIGLTLLAMGIIAAGTYLFSHQTVAELSVGTSNNKAAIKVLTTHEKRLDIDEEAIDRFRKVVKVLTREVSELPPEIAQLHLMHEIQSILDQMQWKFHILALGLEKLRHHKLSSFIVKPKELRKHLQRIRHQLKSVDYHTIMADLNEIYNCDTSYLVFRNQTIRSITHIPIYKPDSLLKIFQYRPVPMRIHNHLMTFQPETSYIAVDQSRSLFRPIPSLEFERCLTFHHIRYCAHNNFYFKTNQPSCVKSLFLSQSEALLQECPVHFTTDTQDRLIKINYEYVIIFHSTKKVATMTCHLHRSQSQSLTFSGLKRFRMFPGCQLTTPSFVVDGSSNVYSSPQEIEIRTPDINVKAEFERLQHHFNVSSATLDSIPSQKNLHIADINALFDKENQAWTIGFSVLGIIALGIGALLICCFCVKCILPCFRTCRDFFSSFMPSSPSTPSAGRRSNVPSRPPPRPPVPSYEIVTFSRNRSSNQDDAQARRSLRNPARSVNILYPEDET